MRRGRDYTKEDCDFFPFFRGSMDQLHNNQQEMMSRDVKALSPEQIVDCDIDALARQLADKYAFDVPVLDRMGIELGEVPFADDGSPARIPIFVPFSGNGEYFKLFHRTAPMLHVRAAIEGQSLMIQFVRERQRIGNLQKEVNELLDQIQKGLDTQHEFSRLVTPQFPTIAANIIRRRQSEFAGHAALTKKLADAGFKLRRRDDEPARVAVPIKPKQIILQSRLAPKGPATPELSLADYEEILKVIQHMVKVFERTPSAFKRMEEEELRTILLVALNGVFQGNATGETFNGEGKTDILVRERDDNIFIGECLIWDGAVKFEKKLTEQLFRYSTWADSKLAAIVFNRKKNFSAVVDSMKQTVAKLPLVAQPMAYLAPNSCRHKFRRADDTQKEFVLTCLAFEVPA